MPDVPVVEIESPSVALVLPAACEDEPNAISAKFVPSASGDDVAPVTAPLPGSLHGVDAAWADVVPLAWLDCAVGDAWYAASCAQRSFCPFIELNTVQSPRCEITGPEYARPVPR
jgi:hypothetical protein